MMKKKSERSLKGGSARYFVGIAAEGEATAYYEEICRMLAARFGVRNLAEYIPPHITLIPPFDAKEKPAAPRFSREYSFRVSGFGRFGARVCFMRVFLPEEMRRECADIAGGRNIKPHISVARFMDERTGGRVWRHLSRLSVHDYECRTSGASVFVFENGRWRIAE